MSLFRALALPLLALLLTGCASLASDRMTGHLKTVMLAQDDPETVRAAAPAFCRCRSAFLWARGRWSCAFPTAETASI